MPFFKSTTGIIITIAVLVLGLGTVLFFTSDESGNQKPELMGLEYPLLTANHIEQGQAHESYNSNPPTSGPHYAQAAQRDFYDRALVDEQVIHNLEHGEIWISYKNADDQTKQELRAIQGRHRGSVVVTQREANPQNVCLASWGRLLCMDALDRVTAENFIKANINNSPEPIAR